MEGFEIPIGLEEWQLVFDAVRCDDAINRLAHGESLASELAEVLCASYRDFPTAQFKHCDRIKELERSSEVPVLSKALQHFCQHQVAYGDR